MAAKKKKIETWEIIVISIGLAIGLYLLVLKPYVIPWVETKIIMVAPVSRAPTVPLKSVSPNAPASANAVPMLKSENAPMVMTHAQKDFEIARLKHIKVKNILDDANQIFGIIASAIGIIIGLKTLLRNMKAKKTA